MHKWNLINCRKEHDFYECLNCQLIRHDFLCECVDWYYGDYGTPGYKYWYNLAHHWNKHQTFKNSPHVKYCKEPPNCNEILMLEILQ